MKKNKKTFGLGLEMYLSLWNNKGRFGSPLKNANRRYPSGNGDRVGKPLGHKRKYSDKGREISLFSYLYVMNLLSLLTELITENENKRKFLSRFPFNGNDIKLFSSGHQTSDRMGDMDFSQIRNYYFDTLDSNRMQERKIRFGVPDSILTSLIITKFKKIYNSFINDPSTEKIRFVHLDEGNEYEEKFDYIEFVLSRSRDMKTFTVVTSAYSINGDFLKKMGIDAEQDPKVILENFYLLPTIYL